MMSMARLRVGMGMMVGIVVCVFWLLLLLCVRNVVLFSSSLSLVVVSLPLFSLTEGQTPDPT